MAAKTPRSVAFSPPKSSHCEFRDEPRTMHNSTMTGEEQSHLVSRLSKANTARAMKCRLWSSDRLDYERRCQESSVLARRHEEDMKPLPKIYPEPGTECDPEARAEIVEHVTRPTHSSRARGDPAPCPRAGVARPAYSAWRPRARSEEERQQLTERLLRATAAHEQRTRDARFRRSGQQAYFLHVPESRLVPGASFTRGGMRFLLNTPS